MQPIIPFLWFDDRIEDCGARTRDRGLAAEEIPA